MKFSSSNSFYNQYLDKKILILVPHQDDELFLCGTIMGGLSKVTSKIFVAFSTNGDFGNSYKKRKRECIRALKIYKISQKHIFFLGYGDQYNTPFGHIYHAPENEIIKSRNGNTCTYGKEYCFKKHGIHKEYTLFNMKTDIRELIEEIYPDVIFCNDLDWHPDHRALSLLFDNVMGEILKSHINYYPEIYKSFIYYLGWDGKCDYRKRNLESTKRPNRYQSNDKRFELSNPYFMWKDRICFPVDAKLLIRKKNQLYYSIRKYRFSINAKKFYDSMMNSDAVYWKRNTVNYALNALIETSSGNSKYLNDFMIVNSTNIMKPYMMPYDCGVWKADKDDLYPCIKFSFSNEVCVDKIVFYRDIESYGKQETLLKVNIIGVKGEKNIEVMIKKSDTIVELLVDNSFLINEIIINIKNRNVGFTEIEIVKERQYKWLKIKIGGGYAYHYYIEHDCTKLPIRIIANYSKTDDVNKELFDVKPNDSCVEFAEGCLFFKQKFKKCCLKISSIKDESVYDIVLIERCKR